MQAPLGTPTGSIMNGVQRQLQRERHEQVSQAIATLEPAAKEAYLQALAAAPTIVATESDFFWASFPTAGSCRKNTSADENLQVLPWDARKAAKALCQYWTHRKVVLGPERAHRSLLHLCDNNSNEDNQKGTTNTGALSAEDVAFYQTGVCVRVAPDKEGRCVILTDLRRLLCRSSVSNHTGTTTKAPVSTSTTELFNTPELINRMARIRLHVLTVCCVLNPATLRAGLVEIRMEDSNSFHPQQLQRDMQLAQDAFGQEDANGVANGIYHHVHVTYLPVPIRATKQDLHVWKDLTGRLMRALPAGLATLSSYTKAPDLAQKLAAFGIDPASLSTHVGGIFDYQVWQKEQQEQQQSSSNDKLPQVIAAQQAATPSSVPRKVAAVADPENESRKRPKLSDDVAKSAKPPVITKSRCVNVILRAIQSHKVSQGISYRDAVLRILQVRRDTLQRVAAVSTRANLELQASSRNPRGHTANKSKAELEQCLQRENLKCRLLQVLLQKTRSKLVLSKEVAQDATTTTTTTTCLVATAAKDMDAKPMSSRTTLVRSLLMKRLRRVQHGSRAA